MQLKPGYNQLGGFTVKREESENTVSKELSIAPEKVPFHYLTAVRYLVPPLPDLQEASWKAAEAGPRFAQCCATGEGRLFPLPSSPSPSPGSSSPSSLSSLCLCQQRSQKGLGKDTAWAQKWGTHWMMALLRSRMGFLRREVLRLTCM